MKIKGSGADWRFDLPPFPHDLWGANNEPINLLLIGEEATVRRAFQTAGWELATASNPWTWLKAALAIALDRPYPTGPVTPIFYLDRPQPMSWQKATVRHSFRQRHHLRVWATDKRSEGRPVWAVAASYDIGIKLIPKPLFISHRPDPDLDKERQLVVDDLASIGARLVGWADLGAGQSGRNAFGDDWRSDGQVAVILVGDG